MDAMIISLAKDVGKQLLSKATGDKFTTLVGQVLRLQEQQMMVLFAVQAQGQQLLMADYHAGRRHLEYASMDGRDAAMVRADVVAARDLFIRAVGQTHYGDLQAVIRSQIAVCSAMLGDYPVARVEAATAIGLIDPVIERAVELKEQSASFARTFEGFARTGAWWTRGANQRDADKWRAEQQRLEAHLDRLRSIRQSITSIGDSVNSLQ